MKDKALVYRNGQQKDSNNWLEVMAGSSLKYLDKTGSLIFFRLKGPLESESRIYSNVSSSILSNQLKTRKILVRRTNLFAISSKDTRWCWAVKSVKIGLASRSTLKSGLPSSTDPLQSKNGALTFKWSRDFLTSSWNNTHLSQNLKRDTHCEICTMEPNSNILLKCSLSWSEKTTLFLSLSVSAWNITPLWRR